MASPATRSGLSPDALKVILITSRVFALIFGLGFMGGGIASIGFATTLSWWWYEMWGTMFFSLMPVALILFAVAMFCLAYTYDVKEGYVTGGLFVGIAVILWIASSIRFSTELIVSVIFCSVHLPILIAAGYYAHLFTKRVAPKMGAPRLATTAGKLILVSNIIFPPSAVLTFIIWRPGLALLGTGVLLGGIGGIILFVALIAVGTKPTPTAAPAVAPPKEKVPIKPAPPKMRIPPKLTLTQTERMVYEYIVDHGGEIDIEECADEFGLSKSDVEQAVKALVKKGKLEPE